MEKRKCPRCGVDKLSERNGVYHCENCGADFSLDSSSPVNDKNVSSAKENKFTHLRSFAPVSKEKEDTAGKKGKPTYKLATKASEIGNITGKIVSLKYQKKLTIARCPVSDFQFGDGVLVKENQQAIFMRNNHSIGCFKPGRYALNDGTLYILNSGDEKGKFTSDLFFYNLPKPKPIVWETYIKVKFYTGEKYETGNMRASGDYLFSIVDLERFLVYVSKQDNIGKKGLTIKEVREYVIPMVLVNMRNEFPKFIQRNLNTQTTMSGLKTKIMSEMPDFLNRTIRQYGIQISHYQIKEMTSDDIAIPGASGGRNKKKLLLLLIVLAAVVALAVLFYFLLLPMMKG